MLDGLEVTVLKLSDVLKDNQDFRFDSNFFKKQYQYIEYLIKKFDHKVLNDICNITHGSTPKYSEIGFKVIRSGDLNDKWRNDDVLLVSNDNDLSFIEENDILISSIGFGSIGKVDLFYNQNQKYATVSEVTILRNCTLNPFYLTIFLKSKFGQAFIEKGITGATGQLHLNKGNILNIPIPILSQLFQSYIEKLVKTAYSKLEQSKILYREAETLLLRELCLDNWLPPKETAAVKSFSESFGKSGRLDAEYYQPKYDFLYDRLYKTSKVKGYDIKLLGDLSKPLKYGSSEKLEYLDEGIPFLRIADLEQNRFSPENIKYISPKAAEMEKSARVKTGDVLISRSGTLGLAVTIPETLNDAIFGSYFIRVRPNQEIVDSTYLTFYINSLIGKLQVEQANTGAIQTNLTIPVIESFLIVCPILEIQKQLVEKVHQSYEFYDESQRLLELAKQAVEIAIEENEEIASCLLKNY